MGVRIHLEKRMEDILAAHLGHHEVQEHHVGAKGSELEGRLPPAGGLPDHVHVGECGKSMPDHVPLGTDGTVAASHGLEGRMIAGGA